MITLSKAHVANLSTRKDHVEALKALRYSKGFIFDRPETPSKTKEQYKLSSTKLAAACRAKGICRGCKKPRDYTNVPVSAIWSKCKECNKKLSFSRSKPVSKAAYVPKQKK